MYLGRKKRLKEGFQEGFTQEMNLSKIYLTIELFLIEYLLTSPRIVVFWKILFRKSGVKIQDPAEQEKRKEDWNQIVKHWMSC